MWTCQWWCGIRGPGGLLARIALPRLHECRGPGHQRGLSSLVPQVDRMLPRSPSEPSQPRCRSSGRARAWGFPSLPVIPDASHLCRTFRHPIPPFLSPEFSFFSFINSFFFIFRFVSFAKVVLQWLEFEFTTLGICYTTFASCHLHLR